MEIAVIVPAKDGQVTGRPPGLHSLTPGDPGLLLPPAVLPYFGCGVLTQSSQKHLDLSLAH
jgi:hypothetical protein